MNKNVSIQGVVLAAKQKEVAGILQSDFLLSVREPIDENSVKTCQYFVIAKGVSVNPGDKISVSGRVGIITYTNTMGENKIVKKIIADNIQYV